MRVPLELVRLILEYLEPDQTLARLFHLRLVSQVFNREILSLLFQHSKRIDAILHRYICMPPRHFYIRLTLQDQSGKPVLDNYSKPWDQFPKSLKAEYYYYRVKRRESGEDCFAKFLWEVFGFEIGVKGLKEDDVRDREDVEMVLRALCGAVTIDGDGKQEKMLFDRRGYLKDEQYEDRLKDPTRLIKDSRLAKLFLAIKLRDVEGVRRALVRGALLDYSSLCFGKESLLFAISEGNVAVVDTMLIYGVFTDPRNRPRQIVAGLKVAVRSGNEDMIRLLVEHPLGANYPSSSLDNIDIERDSDKAGDKYGLGRCIGMYENAIAGPFGSPLKKLSDQSSGKKRPASPLEQALDEALKEAIVLADTRLVDLLISLDPRAPKALYESALIRAIKTSNIPIIGHILSSPISKELNIDSIRIQGTPLLHYALIPIKHKSSRPEIVRLLLTSGADPNLLTTLHDRQSYKYHPLEGAGMTPLMVLNRTTGNRGDTLELFKLLVEFGARDDLKEEVFRGWRGLVRMFWRLEWVKGLIGKELADEIERDYGGPRVRKSPWETWEM